MEEIKLLEEQNMNLKKLVAVLQDTIKLQQEIIENMETTERELKAGLDELSAAALELAKDEEGR